MNNLHLRYFQKVFETQNITKAAAELYISQPALSRAMKQLEKQLGVPLFTHEGRHIKLTPYAEHFYPYVVTSLATLDEGLTTLQTLAQQQKRQAILYLEVASVSIPSLVKTFLTQHPDIQLTIMQHSNLDTTEPVFKVTSTDDTSEYCVPLITEPILIAIPKEHPLAIQDELSLQDLETLPLLLLSEKSALRKTIDTQLSTYDFVPNIASTLDDPATLRSLLNQGLGISFFPLHSWDYSLAKNFVIKPLADCQLERTIYLSSQVKPTDPLFQTIAKTLTEFFQ